MLTEMKVSGYLIVIDRTIAHGTGMHSYEDDDKGQI